MLFAATGFHGSGPAVKRITSVYQAPETPAKHLPRCPVTSDFQLTEKPEVANISPQDQTFLKLPEIVSPGNYFTSEVSSLSNYSMVTLIYCCVFGDSGDSSASREDYHDSEWCRSRGDYHDSEWCVTRGDYHDSEWCVTRGDYHDSEWCGSRGYYHDSEWCRSRGGYHDSEWCRSRGGYHDFQQ